MDLRYASKSFRSPVTGKGCSKTTKSVILDSKNSFCSLGHDSIATSEISTRSEKRSDALSQASRPYQTLLRSEEIRKDQGGAHSFISTSFYRPSAIVTEKIPENTLLARTAIADYLVRCKQTKQCHTPLLSCRGLQCHCQALYSSSSSGKRSFSCILSSDITQNRCPTSGEDKAIKSHPMIIQKSLSSFQHSRLLSNSHTLSDENKGRPDSLYNPLCFLKESMQLEVDKTVTDLEVGDQVSVTRSRPPTPDTLPLPNFLTISPDHTTNFLAFSYPGVEQPMSFLLCRNTMSMAKKNNLSRSLYDIQNRCNLYCEHLCKPRNQRTSSSCTPKMFNTIQMYQYSVCTSHGDAHIGSKTLDPIYTRLVKKNDSIPFVNGCGYNLPSSVSSEDAMQTLRHGMALGKYKYPTSLSGSHCDSDAFRLPFYSTETVAIPEPFRKKFSVEPDTYNNTSSHEDFDDASHQDVPSSQKTAEHVLCNRRNWAPLPRCWKSDTAIEDETTFFEPTNSRYLSFYLCDASTHVPIHSFSDSELHNMVRGEKDVYIKTSKEVKSVVTAKGWGGISDTFHCIDRGVSDKLLEHFAPHSAKPTFVKEARGSIQCDCNEVVKAAFYEKCAKNLQPSWHGIASFVECSLFRPGFRIVAKIPKEGRKMESNPSCRVDPAQRQEHLTSCETLCEDSPPLPFSDAQKLTSRKWLSGEMSFLMGTTTQLSSTHCNPGALRYPNLPQSAGTSPEVFPSTITKQHLDGKPRLSEDDLVCVSNAGNHYMGLLPSCSNTSFSLSFYTTYVTSSLLHEIPNPTHPFSNCSCKIVIMPSRKQIYDALEKNEFVVNKRSSSRVNFEDARKRTNSDTGYLSTRFSRRGLLLSSSSTKSLAQFPLSSSVIKNDGPISQTRVPLAKEMWARGSNVLHMIPECCHNDTLSKLTLCFRDRVTSEETSLDSPRHKSESDSILPDVLQIPRRFERHNLVDGIISSTGLAMGWGKFSISSVNSTPERFMEYRKSRESGVTLSEQSIERLPPVYPDALCPDFQLVSSIISSQEERMERILRSSGILMSAGGSPGAEFKTVTSDQLRKTATREACPVRCYLSCDITQREDGYTTNSNAMNSAETFLASGKGAQSCRTIGESKNESFATFFAEKQRAVKVLSFVTPVDVDALLEAAEERMRKEGTRIVDLSHLNDAIKTFPKSFSNREEACEKEVLQGYMCRSVDQKSFLKPRFVCMDDNNTQSNEFHHEKYLCSDSISSSFKFPGDAALTSLEDE